jgi:nucleoside-diphosphate-sugar epimerase
MIIALTGGTGFIGSHFLRQALEAGHTVRAIRRSPYSKPRIVLNKHPVWLDYQLDKVQAEELRGCQVLVHLAAHNVKYPYDSLANCLRWNLIAVLALFDKARLAGIRRFVVAGSCFEYGRSGERYDAIPTNAPLEPTNNYAASKAAAFIALSQWAESHNLTLQTLRIFSVYGEGEAKNGFYSSLRRAALAGEDFAMTGGEQIRDFMPVEAVAQTFLDRMHFPEMPTSQVKVYNLCYGEPLSLHTFAERCWTNWGARGQLLVGSIPYRNGEVMRYVAGDDKINILHINKMNNLSYKDYLLNQSGS